MESVESLSKAFRGNERQVKEAIEFYGFASQFGMKTSNK